MALASRFLIFSALFNIFLESHLALYSFSWNLDVWKWPVVPDPVYGHDNDCGVYSVSCSSLDSLRGRGSSGRANAAPIILTPKSFDFLRLKSLMSFSSSALFK
jgi:hypothetical protein